jgi:hypothetical protein
MRIIKIILISIILTVSFSKIYGQNKKVFRFKINQICISLKDTDSCFFVCKNADSVLIGKEIFIDLEKNFIIIPSKDNITNKFKLFNVTDLSSTLEIPMDMMIQMAFKDKCDNIKKITLFRTFNYLSKSDTYEIVEKSDVLMREYRLTIIK